MTTMENLPAEAMGCQPDVTDVVDLLRSGKPFVGLLIDDVDRRALALEAVLDRFVDDETRLAWVGNPLRSPLTIERFFLQAVGPEADLRVERDPAELARMLARPAGVERRKLIVVQQPDTMNAETREKLAAMAPYWGRGDVAVQLLFTGGAAFCIPLVDMSAVTVKRPAEAFEEPPPPSRRREALPLVLLLTLAAIGVLASLSPAGRSTLLEPSQRLLGLAESSPADTNAAAPEQATTAVQPEAPARPAPPTETVLTTMNGANGQAAASGKPADVAALRREFDIFLAQRASTVPGLSDAQKDELFREFLTRHRQQMQ